MPRISQRDFKPTATQSRNLDIIKKTSDKEESVTLSGDGADGHIFSMTTESKKGVPLFVQEDISLFEGSVAEANLLPNGANVDMSDYQVVGPWREQDSGDEKNVVSKIYVRNALVGTSATDFSKRVSQSSDDCTNVAGSVDLTFSLVGIDGGLNSNDMGIRFEDVTIPQGETINSATITFTSTETDSAEVDDVPIYGFDADNTSTFSAGENLDLRTKTTATVNWDIPSRTTNQEYTTPDISTIVQEIVDRAGWSSGNAMGFMFVDPFFETEDAVFYDYSSSTTKAALLAINYGTSSPAGSRTVIFRGRTRYVTSRDDVTIE